MVQTRTSMTIKRDYNTAGHSVRLLRKREVAALLACSERMVDRLVAAGRLGKVTLLGAVRFKLQDVDALIAGNTQ